MNQLAPKLDYGEEFFKWYYFGGGMELLTLGIDVGTKDGEELAKAIGVWDPPTAPYAKYFEPKFSLIVQAYVDRASEVYKLLPKTTFIAEGDSFKYYETDLDTLQGVNNASTPFASGSAESGPTILALEEFKPAYLVDPWSTGITSRTESAWQAAPKLDQAWVKNYHAEILPDQYDKQLTQTVDTVSNDGSSNLGMESIDRICSTYAESGVATYVSAATDGDIYWGKSSVLIDRSGDTDDTFGCGAGGGIKLPTTAAAQYMQLGYIDDVVAEIVPYSKRRNFIAITGPKTLNEIQNLIDPKQRYLDVEINVEYTINGVRSRPGRDTGFTVAGIISNGIKIPVFTTRHAANEQSANRSATVTDADIGNFYIIDMDAIELRTAIPITYMETPPEAMLTADMMKTRSWFLAAQQLISMNFRANGSIKYLKKR